MVAVALGPELRHPSEDGNAPTAGGPLSEVDERGAHRDGVCVVGVVDDEPAAAQLVHLAPPRTEGDRFRAFMSAVQRKPERVVCR